MSLLSVTDLSLIFTDKELFKEASFELYKGEHIGLVGQNGAGKSSLFGILLGEVIPDQGIVKWQSDIKLGYLDQYAQIDPELSIRGYLDTAFHPLYNIEQEMNALYELGALNEDEQMILKASRLQEQLTVRDFYSIDSRINMVATGLGLTSLGLEHPVGQLSGGQRAKVIMAKLLLSEPDVLLLDEPTNFLDKEHVDWLAGYLVSFAGAYIVISHDFDFLDRITTGIIDIEFTTIKKYHGKYTHFLQQKTHLRKEYIRQFQSQQKKVEETKAFIRKNKAGVNARIARGRQKQLDRVELIAPPSFTQKPAFTFQELPLEPHTILTVTGLEIGYDYPLLPKMNFSMSGGQKIVITGFNGIGKSTLLKTLIGLTPALSGKYSFSPQIVIGYYEQDLKWADPDITPLQIIANAYPGMNYKSIRRALSRCALKEEHVLCPISTLSGGEQSKVKLCLITLGPCNLLIMDEPTNRLDQETKEVLRQAFIHFGGSIILVSHEETFYRGWTDRTIEINH